MALADTARPDAPEHVSSGMKITIALFIIIPALAVIAAIPVIWGGWLSWTDIILLLVFWAITGGGITVGFHRYFTHGSFKTNRFMKYVLGIAGSMAFEGSVMQWVADHRKHHKFSDEVGDPHSPWRFGTRKRDVAHGLYFAHVGWLFEEEQTNALQYAPDIAKDRDIQIITKLFPLIAAASLLLPAILGGLITWSWVGALTAFFWAGLFRIAFVHHVTWSINSICHVFGTRPFDSRDRSTNVWWLAIPAFGENWHNLHHAEPTAARHGVMKWQLDSSAACIRLMEKTGLARDVRWPRIERLIPKLEDESMAPRLRGYRRYMKQQAASTI